MTEKFDCALCGKYAEGEKDWPVFPFKLCDECARGLASRFFEALGIEPQSYDYDGISIEWKTVSDYLEGGAMK